MLLLTFFVYGISNASHLVGGFLTYEWLVTNGTNTQYRVTLFVYRDCAKDGTNNVIRKKMYLMNFKLPFITC
jgi:hypothetical protein